MDDAIAQLQARLDAMEQGNQKRSFMDKYGSKFSGDEGIGTAILAEMNRRGVDTSAAEEAVQQILDDLRMQASELLNKINQVGAATEAALSGSTSFGGEPPPLPEVGEGAMAPPPPGMESPDIGAPLPGPGEEPPPDMGMGGDMGGPPPEEPMPPEGTDVSDARLKTPALGVLSDKNMKTTNKGGRYVMSDEEMKDIDGILNRARELGVLDGEEGSGTDPVDGGEAMATEQEDPAGLGAPEGTDDLGSEESEEDPLSELGLLSDESMKNKNSGTSWDHIRKIVTQY